MKSHAEKYLKEAAKLSGALDPRQVEGLAERLSIVRGQDGRLFIAGLGGSAANASHAANDFRKLCGIESYALNDGISELTARANDDGWITIYVGALMTSRARRGDALLVLSVGGGSDGVSEPLIAAVDYAKSVGAKVLGIVGRDGGHVLKHADAAVLIPTINADRVTPHCEAFQSVILHCLASHPSLQFRKTRW